MENGLIHIYHGEGKGKTTAAVGLAIRAHGNGECVLFAQFMKDGNSGEVQALKGLPGVLYLCGENLPGGFYSRMSIEEQEVYIKAQNDLFAKVKEEVTKMSQEKGGLLVMDELTYAYSWGILDRKELLVFLKEKPKNLEVVITGRNPEEELLALSNYVTEMKAEKHPFFNGVRARKGIEF